MDYSMKLNREQVLHIAELAKIKLTEDEIECFCEQLSAILDYFKVLEQIDTNAIPPTAMVITQHNVLRDDISSPSLPVEVALANAPHTSEQHVLVKAILE
jgi:aspartyl-tRNA(Asn)/glutamyl-tRNA(Gln) amidotransferase subunit C